MQCDDDGAVFYKYTDSSQQQPADVDFLVPTIHQSAGVRESAGGAFTATADRDSQSLCCLATEISSLVGVIGGPDIQ